MRKVIIISFLLVLGLKGFGQENIKSIDFIEFHMTYAKMRGRTLDIKMSKSDDNVSVHVNDMWNDIDTSFHIILKDYNDCLNSVMKINANELNQALNYDGFDGCTFTIEYGGIFNRISFKIWEPMSDTKKRKLSKYLIACKQILSSVNLLETEYFQKYFEEE